MRWCRGNNDKSSLTLKTSERETNFKFQNRDTALSFAQAIQSTVDMAATPSARPAAPGVGAGVGSYPNVIPEPPSALSAAAPPPYIAPPNMASASASASASSEDQSALEGMGFEPARVSAALAQTGSMEAALQLLLTGAVAPASAPPGTTGMPSSHFPPEAAEPPADAHLVGRSRYELSFWGQTLGLRVLDGGPYRSLDVANGGSQKHAEQSPLLADRPLRGDAPSSRPGSFLPRPLSRAPPRRRNPGHSPLRTCLPPASSGDHLESFKVQSGPEVFMHQQMEPFETLLAAVAGSRPIKLAFSTEVPLGSSSAVGALGTVGSAPNAMAANGANGAMIPGLPRLQTSAANPFDDVNDTDRKLNVAPPSAVPSDTWVPPSPSSLSSASPSMAAGPERGAGFGAVLGVGAGGGADMSGVMNRSKEASSISSASSDGEQGRILFATLLDAGTADGDLDVLPTHAECPICFEDLCSEQVAVFYDKTGPRGKRVCQHIFHLTCCEDLKSVGLCPTCQQPFTDVRPLPDPLEDPQLWFSMVDMDESKSLSKKEVVEVLKAQLPVNSDDLERHLDDLWANWDK